MMMKVLRVVGGSPLKGEINVGGSKNACLAIMSSLPLLHGKIKLQNVPNVSDIRIKLKLLEGFGAIIDKHENGDITFDLENLHEFEPDEDEIRKIRTGFYLLGPLLARLGKAKLPMPGGCDIGSRPVDFHLKGLAVLNADVKLIGGHYIGDASKMQGAEIYLDSPSAGATQHLMATATLVKGCTTIQNASVEPEVIALAQFLKSCGAQIEGDGTSMISIKGVERLEGTEYRVPSDRLQAGTYLIAGAMTQGDIKVNSILPENQTALINKLKEAGAHAQEGPDWVRVWSDSRLKSIRVKTMPYPGFPTDIQQPMSAALALATGSSVVEETIYESRTGHIRELNRMGAKMRIEGRSTLIEGVEHLEGSHVKATDLRAGAALVLAALAAQGESIISNVHFIDRGYEDLEQTISGLGGQIERLDHEPEFAHS